MTERSIPHLRDVFGLGAYRTPYQQHVASPYPNPAQQPDIYPQQSHQMPPTLPNYHSPPHHHHQHQRPPPQLFPPDQPIAAKPSGTRKNRDNYKTLTSGDVKTLERHLSMKKTIRKKIMRDLQQAFVDDPDEFKAEHTNADRMKSNLNMEAWRFGDGAGNTSDNFLVMLRDDQHRSTTQRNANDANATEYNNFRDGSNNAMMAQPPHYYDYDAAATTADTGRASKHREDNKPSFWKRFTFKKKANT